MELAYCENTVLINDVRDFCLEHIFECGQAFRWNPDQSGYTGVVKDKVIHVKYNEEKKLLILENSTMQDYHEMWRHYFDLDRDYGRLKRELAAADKVMEEAVKYGRGIRVLNQDPWETLISFIISANNNITRIKGIIERLSVKFGKEICLHGSIYYTFPTPESLAGAAEEDLKACGCGYRGPYIKKTAGMVADGIISPGQLKKLPYEEAHKTLLSCPGVGNKVADCILLYSMEKTEAFPVDVWVKRVMEYFYMGEEVTSARIKAFAAERFGKAAGLAQQYLFYYAREKKIGK